MKMRTLAIWLDKLRHPTFKDKSKIPESAELCEHCAKWDFSALFLGRDYPACEYGIIKDTSKFHLWDIRSLEALRLARSCPMCSFFVALLVVRGHIKKEYTPTSEKDLVVHFQKDLLNRYIGFVHFCIIERQTSQASSCVDDNSLSVAAQASHLDHYWPDLVETASVPKWIPLLPESGSMGSSWGGTRPEPYCNFAELSSWVRGCHESLQSNHSDCAKDRFKTKTLNTLRLIDVKAMCLSVEQLPTKYAALSYVWGTSRPKQLKLHQKNVEIMSKPDALRKRWKRVPTTIQDAIRVCIECGIQYLWVDALCLIQDTPDLPKHLDKMTEIYDAAVMTIVAACADSAWTGLRGVSIARSISQPRVSFGNMALVEPLPPLGAELENTRWTQRGWTFQEHIFSRRCLIFLNTRVVFQCNRGWIDESINLYYSGRLLRHAKASIRMSMAANIDELNFLTFVECFCKLELTHDSDTLNACRGVMAWLEQKGTQFFWATPTNRMPEGLNFETEGLERRPDYPSWCWLGWRRPHAQGKNHQKFYVNTSDDRGLRLGLADLCEINIPSLRNDHTSDASGSDTLRLAGRDVEKLLILETHVASFSDVDGALFFREDLRFRDMRPYFLTHNDHEACTTEVVSLGRNSGWGPLEEPIYVNCLIIKTDVRRVSERIGTARIGLSKWQTAGVKQRTVYLI